MKQLRNIGTRWAALAAILWAAVLLGGCASGPVFIEPPDMDESSISGDKVVLHTGDSVQVTFVAPSSDKQFQTHEERIKEDGTITPPDIGSIAAAGKTAGELQSDLQKAYNKLYRNVTVTVKAGDRFYYVLGEVTQSGPKPYLGETDIIKAIAAGGGFTDFANKKKVRLIRSNGKKETINYQKAIEDSGYNARIYPGDQVVVPRSIW